MLAAGFGLAQGFTLTRRLGGSDAAPVWLARDSATSQERVLKFQPREGGADRVARQLRSLDGLDDPGLLLPRGHGEEAGQAYLVFDWLPGGSLDQLRGRPPQAWLGAVRTVASALACLHRKDLVHGDVKSANVLLGEGGQARLADFDNLLPAGGAREAQAAVSRFTASPQQRAGEPAQPADDIYGLGAMVHELLHGQPPGYGGADAPLGRPPGTPAALDDLIQRCLADPVPERPASMAVIEQALGEIAVGIDTLPERALAESPAGGTERRASPLLTPPEAPAASLRPQWQRPAPASEPADARAIRRQGFRMGLAAAAVVLLLAAAVAVFVLPLGRRFAVAVPNVTAQVAPSAPPEESPAAAAPAAAAPAGAVPSTPATPPAASPPAPSPPAATPPAASAARTAAPRPAAPSAPATPSTGKFAETMARGYASLKAGQYPEARTAFEEARSLQPEDSGVAQALAELTSRESNQQIVEAMKAGSAFLSAGKWSLAAPQFQRALELDGSLTAARTGLAQANERIDLDNRLAEYLERPERTFSPAGVAAGQELLARIEAVANPDPALVRQSEQLKDQLHVATTPLNLELQSDNLTQINVYRVGELGALTTRSLQLKPGHYVVVGSRAGFRDVRVELDLTPSTAPLSVRVICREPI